METGEQHGKISALYNYHQLAKAYSGLPWR